MITSVKNDKVKQWKKLQKRKEREVRRVFLIEGFHLIEEAWKSNWNIKEIIVSEQIDVPEWINHLPMERVGNNVLLHLSQTKTPQGIIAVVEMKEYETRLGNHVLLIDGVQDPGNLGTIIRTADAAGINQIILGEGTVDLYNDKVIRATQGSLFHVSIIRSRLEKEIAFLKKNKFTIWASALQNAKNYNDIIIEKDENIALILGNEGSGIQQQFIEMADEVVKIPIYGKAESLNVSIAAGILMYYLKG